MYPVLALTFGGPKQIFKMGPVSGFTTPMPQCTQCTRPALTPYCNMNSEYLSLKKLEK